MRSTFDHGEVLACDILKAFHGRIAAHGFGKIFLVAHKHVHGMFKIARQEVAHILAVKPDHLAQEIDGQQILTLGFFFENDLGQNRAGDVF